MVDYVRMRVYLCISKAELSARLTVNMADHQHG